MPYAVKNDSALVGLETVNMSKLTKSNIEYPHCSSLNSLFINDESSRYKQSDKGKGGYTYVSADVNVTLAHELGHYLGLHHIYTERNSEPVDSCGDTDFCEDTPSYNRIEYQQYITGRLIRWLAIPTAPITKRTRAQSVIPTPGVITGRDNRTCIITINNR